MVFLLDISHFCKTVFERPTFHYFAPKNQQNQQIIENVTTLSAISYEKKVDLAPLSLGGGDGVVLTLCDPQTSGGLLAAVDARYENDFITVAKKSGFGLKSFGFMKDKTSIFVVVK